MILKLPSNQRTEDRIRIVLLDLMKVVPEYTEFPSSIQKSIIKVCYVQKFGAGRVIIRQGHTADCFYLIVSGISLIFV
jgi:CRP-like cAMP-binding protein